MNCDVMIFWVDAVGWSERWLESVMECYLDGEWLVLLYSARWIFGTRRWYEFIKVGLFLYFAGWIRLLVTNNDPLQNHRPQQLALRSLNSGVSPPRRTNSGSRVSGKPGIRYRRKEGFDGRSLRRGPSILGDTDRSDCLKKLQSSKTSPSASWEDGYWLSWVSWRHPWW